MGGRNLAIKGELWDPGKNQVTEGVSPVIPYLLSFYSPICIATRRPLRKWTDLPQPARHLVGVRIPHPTKPAILSLSSFCSKHQLQKGVLPKLGGGLIWVSCHHLLPRAVCFSPVASIPQSKDED